MTTHNMYTLSSTIATAITPGLDSGFDITIQNIHPSDYVYVGAEDVSSISYGFRISPGAAFSVELSGEDDLFLLGSSDSTQAAVLRVNLERSF